MDGEPTVRGTELLSTHCCRVKDRPSITASEDALVSTQLNPSRPEAHIQQDTEMEMTSLNLFDNAILLFFKTVILMIQ